MTVDTSQRLLTPSEVAAMLGVKVQTLALWRSTQRYDLRYIKIGSAIRYRAEDVLQFIERQTVSPASH
ncbi:MAG: helix-turn-helix domain-containing protein [Planctomycetaceae bacterium]|nr:helix-turn-helix domain-containing protein [Planctomycetaceae bacterium]